MQRLEETHLWQGPPRWADAEADLVDRDHPETEDRVRRVVGRQGDGQLAEGKDSRFWQLGTRYTHQLLFWVEF